MFTLFVGCLSTLFNALLFFLGSISTVLLLFVVFLLYALLSGASALITIIMLMPICFTLPIDLLLLSPILVPLALVTVFVISAAVLIIAAGVAVAIVLNVKAKKAKIAAQNLVITEIIEEDLEIEEVNE